VASRPTGVRGRIRHAVGLLENADYVALDVAITVHVRGLQTGPILVENQPFRIRQIIGLPMIVPP
jgi:hypothetical protein